MKYLIYYSGWTTTEVEADSPEEAIKSFWDDGMNELNDAVIDQDPQPIPASGAVPKVLGASETGTGEAA